MRFVFISKYYSKLDFKRCSSISHYNTFDTFFVRKGVDNLMDDEQKIAGIYKRVSTLDQK